MVQRLKAHSQRGAAGLVPERDVVALGSGEPDFETPASIIDAMNEALAAGYTHYAPPRGDPELVEALAGEVSSRSVQSFSAGEILVTAGGRAGLASAVLGVVGPGDRVVIPEPTYSMYADLARVAGAEPVLVPPADGLRLDIDAIESAADGGRLLVLCNPCNPTGVVHTEAELREVGRIADEYGLLVLVDEAYDRITYDGVRFTSSLGIPAFAERLIYCQTFSKTYAMTGWRCGYLAAPKDVIDAADRIHRSTAGPVNTAVQRAAIVALSIDDEVIEGNRRIYQRRRDLAVDLLPPETGCFYPNPEGAFYLFIRYPNRMSSKDFVARALEHGVALRPGVEFGPSGEGHARLAFCVDEHALEVGIERLVRILGRGQ